MIDNSGYIKDFDNWFVKKKFLHERAVSMPQFKERDIWWVSIGINVGFEEDGKHDKFIRPVLVLRKFNREMFLGIPMSTKLKDNPYYKTVSVNDRIVSVLISQIRVFSAKRIQDKLAELDKNDFEKIKEDVVNMISFSLSPKRESRG